MQSGLYDADRADAPPPPDGRRAGAEVDSPAEAQPRPSWWRGIVLGLLATAAGLAVAELVVGLVDGASSPVVPVGQEFIDVTPAWLKEWAIEQFGTSDKAVLVTGALVVILGFGMAIGIFAVRGDRFFASALTVAIGVIGAWAVWMRPEPTLAKFLPTIVGTSVSLAVLWSLTGGRSTDDGDDGERSEVRAASPTMGPDRRQFVLGAVTIGSAAAVAGGIGRVLQQNDEVDTDFTLVGQDPAQGDAATSGGDDATAGASASADGVDVERAARPEGTELGVDGIESWVVPNDDFYRIDTALVVPQVDRDDWRLTISGMVDSPIELTYADIESMPQIERYITLSCVSNPVGGDLVGNARWQGVRLADVLDQAGVHADAEQLVSRSVDGWTCGTPVEAVMDGRDALLAIGMNGRPLPARHGFPVRMVVPGLFGYVSATKWVTEMRLTRWEDFDAYWVPRGWAKRGPVKTMARIDTPRSGASASGTVRIGGVAWAVHRGVSAVEVRVDGGDWRAARLGTVPSADTWVQWLFEWDSSSVEPGRHAIEVRAIDGDGAAQPAEPAPAAPDGAQGYHRITLDV